MHLSLFSVIKGKYHLPIEQKTKVHRQSVRYSITGQETGTKGYTIGSHSLKKEIFRSRTSFVVNISFLSTLIRSKEITLYDR